jgi:hypothetical protein
MNKFEHRCNLASRQYRVNLGQKPSWVLGVGSWAIENGAVLVIENTMVIKMYFGHHKILIAILLAIEKFQSPYIWQLKPIFSHQT